MKEELLHINDDDKSDADQDESTLRITGCYHISSETRKALKISDAADNMPDTSSSLRLIVADDQRRTLGTSGGDGGSGELNRVERLSTSASKQLRDSKGDIYIPACGSDDEFADDAGQKIFRCKCGREFESRGELDKHLHRKEKRLSRVSQLASPENSTAGMKATKTVKRQVVRQIQGLSLPNGNQKHALLTGAVRNGKQVYACRCGRTFPSQQKVYLHVYGRTQCTPNTILS